MFFLAEKGESGDPGGDGRDGYNGAHGHLGLTGPRGPKGSVGKQGPLGWEGRAGFRGSFGLEGVKGERGTDGILIGAEREIPGQGRSQSTNILLCRNRNIYFGISKIMTKTVLLTLSLRKEIQDSEDSLVGRG